MKKDSVKQNPTSSIPKEPCIDQTIQLILEGYLYIPNRMRKYHTDIFQTRLLGQKAVCLSGREAAAKFYDQNLFTRKGAVPKRIQETLFGKKAIQTMDGAPHMDRKQLFLSFMTPDSIDRIIKITQKQWEQTSRSWGSGRTVVLFREAGKIYFQAACQWAGVPLRRNEIRNKAHDMSSMIDAFGAVGPRHQKGRAARNRSELWATELILNVRAGKIKTSKDSILYSIAWYKDLNGQLLPQDIAAIELINILRPITAIATYITFGALALHMYPEYREKLYGKDDSYLTMFAQEVRRFYPFGPFLGARVRNSFTWRNHSFRKGDLVFLDIYGTNHDPVVWSNPNLFLPEHFAAPDVQPFDFIPQGGGDAKSGTRCPGEWLVIELLKTSLNFLSNNLEYEVPLQDLSYPLNRIPALPRSGFLMSGIRNKGFYDDLP